MSKNKKVSYTDYERSGVTYTDAEGNPVSKEEMYEADEKPKGVRPIAKPDQKIEGERPIAKPGKKPAARRLPDKPISSILEEESIRYIQGKKDGGMNGCPYRRKGAKSNIQGIKDIQVKGGKFIGCK